MWCQNKSRKKCIVREPTLEKYLVLVCKTESYFKGLTVEHIEHNKNAEADDLVKVVARNTPMPADVFFQVTKDTSVKTVLPEHRLIIEGEDWRAPIMAYLHHYYEPDNKNE
jgi:hypothetical protein